MRGRRRSRRSLGLCGVVRVIVVFYVMVCGSIVTTVQLVHTGIVFTFLRQSLEINLIRSVDIKFETLVSRLSIELSIYASTQIIIIVYVVGIVTVFVPSCSQDKVVPRTQNIGISIIEIYYCRLLVI